MKYQIGKTYMASPSSRLHSCYLDVQKHAVHRSGAIGTIKTHGSLPDCFLGI